MEASNSNDVNTESDNGSKQAGCASRPSTLNILLENNSKIPSFPSFRTPCLGDIQLMSEVEKIIQQLKASPQTPGTFLNPEHVTEEQERLANAFSQKLTELQEANNLSSLSTGVSSIVNASNIYNLKLSELQQQQSFVDLCRQTAQAQQNLPTTASILLCSPQRANPNPATTGSNPINPSVIQQCNTGGATISHLPKGSVAITLPSTFSNANELSAALQLNNGLRFEIVTNDNMSQSSVLRMLGINTSSIGSGTQRLEPENSSGTSVQPITDSWKLQTSLANSITDSLLNESGINTTFVSSQDDNDTRPSSSLSNSNEHHGEGGRRRRSSSSASSTSSASQSKYVSGSNAKDTRLDPTEQSRMRLERKRARNRDAARKCRERKIRLIKNLEKDVQQLTDENRALKNSLSRTEIEVKRYRQFVANHLDKDCSLVTNKVS